MISESSRQVLAIAYPLLKELPAPLIRNIKESSYDLAAQAGHVLFDVGEDCGYVPMLISGSLRVVKPFRTGWEMVLYRVVPGQICILTVTCLLSNRKHLARVVAEKDVEAVSIPKEHFSRLIEASSKFREFVYSNYSSSLLSLLDSVEGALTQPIERRVAKLLLDRRTDLIEATHQGLADEVGTAREVVSRILEDFEKKGIVKLRRGFISIRDREALVQALQITCD
jgi:CRP/FNR family transcriptional regulator